jgi:hypothetical protein
MRLITPSLHLAAEHDLNTPQTPIEYLLGKAGYLKSSYALQRLKQIRRRGPASAGRV